MSVVGADVRAWSDSGRAASPTRAKTDENGIARFPGNHGSGAHTRVFADGYLFFTQRSGGIQALKP